MYYSYPELELIWKSNQSEFDLRTPWTRITVEVDPAQKNEILELSKPPFKTSFLEYFKDHPVSYLAPRRAAELPEAPHPVELSAARVSGTDGYDPLSAYGLIRRERHLIEQSAAGRPGVYAVLDELRALDEPRFFQAAALILRQTYHVTSNAMWALEPALALPGLDSRQVKAFREEERGHEALILRSFKALGFDGREIESFPVLDETRESISALRKAAESSALSFCCLVGLFEGDSHSASDPMAELLRKSSKPQAAIGLESHFQINRNGGHSQIGELFARDLPLQSALEVTRALHETRHVARLGLEMTERLIDRVGSC